MVVDFYRNFLSSYLFPAIPNWFLSIWVPEITGSKKFLNVRTSVLNFLSLSSLAYKRDNNS